MTVTCKERSQKWVHMYAAGGAAFATVPIPFATTLGLGALETHMIYWVAKIYGEDLPAKQIAMVAGGLELGGLVLKAIAMEACNFIPVAGWVVKGAIAASAIEGIGHVIVGHYEDKFPGKVYTKDVAVESSLDEKK